MTVGLVDAVKPNVSADNPFYVRLGIWARHRRLASAGSVAVPYPPRLQPFLGGLVEPTDSSR
jgi:hypothetical protein